MRCWPCRGRRCGGPWWSGAIYGVAQILQTAGLAHTAASVSGFITGMYVVCTPLLAALLLKTRITAVTWGAVLLATAGLGVLTLDGFSVGYGEALTFVASVLYALHIVALGAWSTARDALGMSVVQLLVIAVICLVATAPDGVVLPETRHDWLAVVYMALVAGALALVAQTWAQSQLSPTRTAIIMSMEPVFAAFFAVLLGGEGADLADAARRRNGAGRDARGRARAHGARSRARSSTSPSEPTGPRWV